MKDKKCSRCSNIKPLSEFYKHIRRKDGFRDECKACTYQQRKKWNDNNQIKALGLSKKKNLKKALLDAELSQKEYDYQLSLVGNICPICGKKSDIRLCIDHDHETNSFRGLICSSCNIGIGAFFDSPVFLRLAADYLEVASGKLKKDNLKLSRLA